VPAVGYDLQDEDARALTVPILELLQDIKVPKMFGAHLRK
jgi:hypothetical protein